MKHTSFLIAALAFIFNACGNQTPSQETAAEKTAVHPEAGLIHLGADQVKRAGITWGAVENRAISTNLALTGELRIHPENRAVVSAFSAGILSNLHTGLNRNVQKGDLIATLRNPELVDLQQQYLENRDKLAFLKTEFERYKTLRDDNATAAKNLLKAELKRKGVTYAQLAEKLAAMDIHETERNLNNKISRGGFSAAFLLQCLEAVGARNLALD